MQLVRRLQGHQPARHRQRAGRLRVRRADRRRPQQGRSTSAALRAQASRRPRRSSPSVRPRARSRPRSPARSRWSGPTRCARRCRAASARAPRRRRRAAVARVRVVRLVRRATRRAATTSPARWTLLVEASPSVRRTEDPHDRVHQSRPRPPPPRGSARPRRRARGRGHRRRILLVRDGRGAQRRRPGDGAVGVVGRVAHRLRLAVVLLRPPADVDGLRAGRVRVRGARRLPALARPGPRRCSSSAWCCSSWCSSPASGSTCRARAAGSASAVLRFQPSEIAKLALLLFAADLLSRRAGELARLAPRAAAGGAASSPCSRLLVMKEPDLGSTMVLALIVVLAVLVAGGVPKRAPRDRRSPSASPRSRSSPLAEPYRRARMLTFLHPFADVGEHGLPDLAVAHRARQRRADRRRARRRAGRSGTSCRTRTPTSSSPSSARSSGSSVASSCSALFVALRRCSASASRCARPTASACCSPPASRRGSSGRRSSTSARSSACCPVTGIPLPFVSFGGSSLVITMLATGILVNVARQGRATPARATRPAPRATVTAADVAHQRRRHRRPRVPRARARRGARRPRARPRAGPLRRRRSAASRRPRSRPPASPSTCCPGAASSGGSVARHRRAEPPHRVGHRRRRRPGGPAGAAAAARAWSWASAATRRSRRWSAPASRACRPSCTRPTPRPAWPTGSRCASVLAPRSRSPGRRSPGAVVTGNPDPPRHRRRAPGAGAHPRWSRWSAGASGRARSTRRSLGLYDRWRDRERRHDPPRERCPRLRRVPHPAGSATPTGRHARLRLVPYEEHMEAIYTDAALVVSRSGGMTARAHRGRRARGARAAARRARRPPDRATREALAAAGAAVVVRDAELDPARLDAELDRAARRPRPSGARWATPRARSGGPTPPPASPTSSRRYAGAPVTRRGDLRPRSHLAALGAHRRRRRRGHERDRHGARAHGPPRERLRPQASRAALERLGLLGVTTHVGHARRARPDRRSTRSSSPPRSPRRNLEVVAAPRARHPGAAPRRRAARHRRHPHDHRGRRHPRQDHDVVDARADPARAPAGTRASSSAASSTRSAPTRCSTSGEWLVVEADESDGTFLELGARRRGRHQRRARPPRPLRRLRRARRRVRDASSPGSPASVRAVRRRRRRRRHRRRASRRAPSPTGSPTGADYRIDGYEGGRARHAGSRSSRSRRAARRGRAAGARPAQRGERGRARPRSRSSSGCPSTRSRARSARFGGVARRFQFRGERDGVTFVDDYAHLPSEVARHDPRRARRRLGAGGRRVPAPPLHADRGAVARLRRRVRRRRRARAHRRLPRGRAAPARGLRAARAPTPCSTPTPKRPSPTCRGAPTSSRTCRALARPGDVVLTLGAGDLTTLPDEWLGARVVTAGTAGSRPRRARRPRLAAAGVRSRATCPSADAHHLPGRRPAGGARPGRVADDDARRGRRRRWPHGVPPLLVVGRGLEPARRRRRVRRGCGLVLGGEFERRRPRRRIADVVPGRRGGTRCRCSPGAPPAAGSRGLEFFVGIPGSVGGAVRMNAGGHGARPPTCSIEARRRRPGGRGGGRAHAPARRRPRVRLPALGARPDRGGHRRRRSAAAAATAAACEATIAEIVRWRREHQPGGSERGLGVRQPARRLRRPAHRRRWGSRACGSGARWCRRSTPTSSRPRPAPPPTTCRARGRGPAAGARRHRHRASCPSCAWSASTTTVAEAEDDGSSTRAESAPDPAGRGRRRRPGAEPPAPSGASRRRRRLAVVLRHRRGAGGAGVRRSRCRPCSTSTTCTSRGAPPPHRGRRSSAAGGHPPRRRACCSLDPGRGRAPASRRCRGSGARRSAREWPGTVRDHGAPSARPVGVRCDGPTGKAAGRRHGRVVGRSPSRPSACPQLLGVKIVPASAARSPRVGAARSRPGSRGSSPAATASVDGDATTACVARTSRTGPEVRLGRRRPRSAAKVRAALAVLAGVGGDPVAYIDVSVPTNPVAG